MGVTFDTSGVTNTNTSATSQTIDITAAAVGAWCYALLNTGANATTNNITTPSGWTLVGAHQPTGQNASLGLYKRQKQTGDTTFTISYASTFKAVVVWSSYLGLDPNNPDDGADNWLDHASASASYVSATVTNNGPAQWAAFFCGSRSTGATYTMTSDAALVERQDVVCATTTFFGASIDDSNGVIVPGSHTYTETCTRADANGGTWLVFLNPVPPTQLLVNSSAISRASLY